MGCCDNSSIKIKEIKRIDEEKKIIKDDEQNKQLIKNENNSGKKSKNEIMSINKASKSNKNKNIINENISSEVNKINKVTKNNNNKISKDENQSSIDNHNNILIISNEENNKDTNVLNDINVINNLNNEENNLNKNDDNKQNKVEDNINKEEDKQNKENKIIEEKNNEIIKNNNPDIINENNESDRQNNNPNDLLNNKANESHIKTEKDIKEIKNENQNEIKKSNGNEIMKINESINNKENKRQQNSIKIDLRKNIDKETFDIEKNEILNDQKLIINHKIEENKNNQNVIKEEENNKKNKQNLVNKEVEITKNQDNVISKKQANDNNLENENNLLNNSKKEKIDNDKNQKEELINSNENTNKVENKKEPENNGEKEINNDNKIKNSENNDNQNIIEKNKYEKEIKNENISDKEKKEDQNNNIIEDKKEIIKNNEKVEESLDNKQNEILNQDNKEKDKVQNKEKETEINQSKEGEKQNLINKEKENLSNNQKESNINNGLVISKKENGLIQKYKESEIASNENNYEDKVNNHKELSYNKDICKKIASSLPARKEGDYSTFKRTIKEKTEKLNDTEKSYVLYLWICENISYDTYALINPIFVVRNPESVYDLGKSSCIGYSNLFKDLSDFLNLEVKCIECYVKGYDYNVGSIIFNSNHEYNVIKLNNKWYHIDCTWGAGDIGNDKFIKCFKEFYFLADPEILIKSHFPENDEWQLTQKKYTLDEFLGWPEIKLQFYKLGFKNFFPNEGSILLKDSNTQKFIIYGDNMNIKGAMCDLFYYENKVYHQKLRTTKVNFFDDRFEVDTIFNKKGEYLIEIFASDNRKDNYLVILKYSVTVENDIEKEIFFPRFYKGNEGINVIEPLYDNLKSGETVKFLVKSNYEKLIVSDDMNWINMIKKENGIFELEIKIKAKKNNDVSICIPKEYNTISSLVSYKVVDSI